MENDTTVPKEGLLEPVPPGSVTFDDSILVALRNSYLYGESKERFTYSSAHLIKNTCLQKRYSDFRAEKRANGYAEEELDESFGFLLFEAESRANELAETGLIVGQNTCTTLGDSSKGVYVCKYSDCLDEKLWYDGKTGYTVILKLTKGRVKEVTENYTQNFTPPTVGFDCHVSEHLSAVCATTSSFLAFERTRYFMYELLHVGGKFESCPRHVCPYAVVAFSYGKTSLSLELKDKGHEKSSFHYQPWSGKLQIKSHLFDVGLKSVHGAMFPAHLPKTVQVDHAIGVSELRKTLPQAVFETSLVGEVSLDGQCFNLYDVAFFEAKEEISLLINELKEKDMALVISLDDRGFLILLHSSHFLSYEGSGTDKSSALQGMFIFPNTRTVPKETKTGQTRKKVPPEVFQVLPALNYAESEMEKCPPNQNVEPVGVLEKHLENFAALICPGLSSSPSREASMFPDQYDVPDGFPLMAPKWTENAGTRLQSYLEKPCSFQIPLSRALEILAAGKQQRSDDHDDDVCYYISSPEEIQQSPNVESESIATEEDGCVNVSSLALDEEKHTEQQAEKQKALSAELSHAAFLGEASTPGTVVVATADNSSERKEPSPRSGDLSTEHHVNCKADSESTSQHVTVNKCTGGLEKVLKETQFSSEPVISSTGNGSSSGEHIEVESLKNTHCNSQVPRSEDQTSFVGSDVSKEAGLPKSISPPTPSESSGIPQTRRKLNISRRHGRRKRRGLKRRLKLRLTPPPLAQNTMSQQTETLCEQRESEVVHSSPSSLANKDWRSLPRRKRQWKADVAVKRVLRSDAKTSETEALERSPASTELNVTEKIITSTPKRKAEGISMRERYGLKTIITDCGKVFVPHGSEVSSEGVISSEKNPQKTNSEKVEATQSQTTESLVSSTERNWLETVQRKEELHSAEVSEGQDSSSVITESPSKEWPSALSLLHTPASDAEHPSAEMETKAQPMPLTHIENMPAITSPKAVSSQAQKDVTSCTSSDPPLDSSERSKGKAKSTVYKAISISKLKTVLRRAKRTVSPDKGGDGKSASDSADPVLKKSKANSDVESCKQSLSTDAQDHSSAVQHDAESTGSQDPGERGQSKQISLSQRELRSSPSQEKLKSDSAKENGCISFDTPASHELVKQADQQLISTLRGNRTGGKNVCGKDGFPTGVSLPSDALNLLADLALGANSEKSLANLGSIPSQETHGVKSFSTPSSVLHTLLRGPSAKLKLPPKSASPERLVATGNLILEISKEHSYSQPTSLLLGLAGANPHIPPPISIESLLSLKAGVHLKLPDGTSDSFSPDKGGKMGRRLLMSLEPSISSGPKSRVRKTKFLRHRCIVEKEGSIQVTRSWKEIYDFRFDSKFTNDCLDKTVTRALHGKWDFGIEDTYEQVHLILHMWIGLFYSKHISRFFHFDHNIPRKDAPLEKTEKSISPVQADTSPVDADLSSEKDKTSALPLAADVLDLSVKTPGSVEHDDVIKERDEKKLAPNSVMKASLECTLANKEPARTQTSASVVKQLSFLSYRSTSDISDNCSIHENDDNSDPENDTTDSTYTEDLEKNSEYSHLCEKATHMCLDKQKSLKMLKRHIPEAVPIKGVGKINFGPKAVTIFHKVVDSLRPLNISEAHGQASGRKIILKSLCFKHKPADGTAASVGTENGPKAEDCVAATLNKENNNNSAPVVECSENDKDDSELKIESEKDSTCTSPVCESKSTDNTSVDVHDDKDKEVEETSPVGCDIRDDTCVAQGDKETDSPVLDVRYEMSKVGDDMSVPDVKNETSSELHDMNNDGESNDMPVDVEDNSTTCAGQSDSLVELQNEEHEDDVEDEVPVYEAGCNVSEHDESNETEGECDENDNEKVEVKMPHDVTDNTSAHIQEVTDEAKDEVHEVKADADAQDVADDENESVRAYEVENVEGVRNQEVIQAHELKEHNFEKNESTASKEITEECVESEMSEGARPVCDEETETDGGEQNDVADLNKDDGNGVDMDMCDENDSEDDTQRKMLEVNVACVDTLEQITNAEERIKPHEVEIRSEASVVSMDKEQTKDDAQPEVAKDSSADNVNSTVNPFVTLTEGSTSPAIACTYIPAEDNCESTKLDNSAVVQVKAPEISLVKPVRAGGDLSPASEIVDREPGEVDDSALRDSTTYDVVDLNASVVQSSDSSVLETLSKKVTDHKSASSEICETSAETQDYNNQSVFPTALEIGADSEAYSRSCTPTQDELPYSKAVCEEIHESGNLQDNHDFYRDLSPVNSSPPDTQYGIDPDRYEPLHTEEYVDKHFSSSSHYRAQFFSQDPSWSENMFVETKSSLTDEHVPKRYSLHFDQDAIPPSRDSTFKKNSLRKDLLEPADKSFFSNRFDEQLSETSLSRARPGLKTAAPNKLRELCSYDDDDDSESSFTHFKSRRFAQKGLAHMPEKTETSDWAQQMDYADSVFTLDENIKRDFHCRPTDLYRDHSRKKYPSNEESESHETDSTSHSRKKPKNSVCRHRSKKEFDGAMDYNIRKTVSCLSDQAQMSKAHSSTQYQHTKPFDWRRYFRREGVFDTNEENDPPSSIVTVFDSKGHRAIYESPSVLKQPVDTCSVSRTVENFHHLEGQPLKSNITQSLIEHEYLTFSEKLNHMLRNCKDSSQDRSQRLNSAENPMTIQFSRLEEDDGFTALEERWPTLNKFKISVEMPDRKARGETVKRGKPLHLQSLMCDRVSKAASSKIAEVTKECSKSYNTMMDHVCSGKAVPQCSGTNKRKRDLKSASGNKRSRFCGRIQKDLRSCIARLHDGLNSIVRQACRTKYEFFIMATSSDPLFDTTKELLEEEGHTAVEPHQFDFDASNKTPLLIILRNEDISELMCEVPYLLELKKSPRVLFAGIDQPDDVINLTHQELFAKGGFVVFDETTLDQLSLENMKNVVSTLEELDKKGKWKWFLHYKDSRKFRENARFSPEAQKRKNFIDCCQEAGLLEVLPYHECDVISRDRPDYLRCLICLQIQYASVRFPVFISDAPADSFHRNGILIMNIATFTQIL